MDDKLKLTHIYVSHIIALTELAQTASSPEILVYLHEVLRDVQGKLRLIELPHLKDVITQYLAISDLRDVDQKLLRHQYPDAHMDEVRSGLAQLLPYGPSP